MPREVTLNETDIQELEDNLAATGATMTDEERNFTEHLLNRGRAGQQATRPAGGVSWTWTYRF